MIKRAIYILLTAALGILILFSISGFVTKSEITTGVPSYCPSQYFKKLHPKGTDFAKLSKLIQRYGKKEVFHVIYQLSQHNLTIRIDNKFRSFRGAPSIKYVDQCTMMYDLIRLNLSPTELEKNNRAS